MQAIWRDFKRVVGSVTAPLLPRLLGIGVGSVTSTSVGVANDEDSGANSIAPLAGVEDAGVSAVKGTAGVCGLLSFIAGTSGGV